MPTTSGFDVPHIKESMGRFDTMLGKGLRRAGRSRLLHTRDMNLQNTGITAWLEPIYEWYSPALTSSDYIFHSIRYTFGQMRNLQNLEE